MRLLVLLLAVMCSAASAQTVAFRPLAIGDTWTYEARRVASTTSATCTLPTAATDRVQADVLRDTTLNGAAARVVGCTRVLPGGAPVSTGRIAVPLTFADAVAVSGDASCLAAFTPGPASVTPGPSAVGIGGRSYTMGATATDSFSGGSCAFSGGHARLFGDLVGKLSDREFRSTGCAAPPSCSTVELTLVYAVVGGTAYGTRPVAGEDTPVGAAAQTLRAYPVPAAQAVTVESGVRAAVEVVDALGRLVASGEAGPGRPLVLDVSGWPAGVYVARTVGGTVQTVRLVVAR